MGALPLKNVLIVRISNQDKQTRMWKQCHGRGEYLATVQRLKMGAMTADDMALVLGKSTGKWELRSGLQPSQRA